MKKPHEVIGVKYEKVAEAIKSLLDFTPVIVLAGVFIYNAAVGIPQAYIMTAVLGALLFLSFQVALSIKLRTLKIERNTEELSEKMKSPICAGYVINLRGTDSWYEYVAAHMRLAEFSIRDASLTTRTWPTDSASAQRYNSSRDDMISNKSIEYKYLTVFQTPKDLNRLDAVAKRLKRVGGKGGSYWVRTVELDNIDKALLFNFVIIDAEAEPEKNKEVIVAYYNTETGPSEQSIAIMNNPEAVALFTRYFDYVFQNNAKALDDDLIKSIRKRLTLDTS